MATLAQLNRDLRDAEARILLLGDRRLGTDAIVTLIEVTEKLKDLNTQLREQLGRW